MSYAINIPMVHIDYESCDRRKSCLRKIVRTHMEIAPNEQQNGTLCIFQTRSKRIPLNRD